MAKKKAKKDKVTRTGLMTRAQTAIGNALDCVSIDADNRVEEIVNKGFAQVVWSALGFTKDSTWSDAGWKLDTCNGRNGKTPAGKALHDEVCKAVKRRVKPILAAIPKEIPKELITDLKDRWLEYYRREAQDRVMDHAKRVARAEVDAAFQRELKKHGLGVEEKERW